MNINCQAKIITDQSIVNNIENLLDSYSPDFIINTSNVIASNISMTNIVADLLYPIKKYIHIVCGNTYIYYIIDNCIYVDLCHILSSVISSQEYIDLLQKYSPDINLFQWVLKNNGTYIRRQLINMSTLNKIMMQNNNIFSLNYKIGCLYYMIVILYLWYNVYILSMFIKTIY
ncbi:hypothetical protein QKC54_gp0631 [Megavirus baoshan]|uniref:Uncharacterized protein n=1 Tax=Megavirus baoshan TaxID=2496520 RepID=A0A3Q8U7M2_9VIRU|nr:hypothetical protein QKC54_gp0631 [Megavirus baoshan]AZL89205.1 hypothetical protein Mb0441 [Megavirus baoshan]